MIPLRWRATHFPPSPPEQNDGVCLDGEATVGRVLLNDHGPTRGEWMWSMTACAPGVDARAFEASTTDKGGGEGCGRAGLCQLHRDQPERAGSLAKALRRVGGANGCQE